jgi:hypothetical protein
MGVLSSIAESLISLSHVTSGENPHAISLAEQVIHQAHREWRLAVASEPLLLAFPDGVPHGEEVTLDTVLTIARDRQALQADPAPVAYASPVVASS